MTNLPTSPFSSLPALAKPAVPALDMLLSSSAAAFMAVFNPYDGLRDTAVLRERITSAEKLLASAEALRGQFCEGVEPLSASEIKGQLAQFGSAWPNVSKGDLAGYGMHLFVDVEERSPCRYALWSALRHLRQTSRFLPSIAEVMTALDEAQTRIRNTAWHLRELPAALERARADLARAEAMEARQARSAPEVVP